MRWILAMLFFYTAPIDALKPDSIRVDSLLVVATDTTLSFKQRAGVLKEAIRYDASGRTMHALARLYMTSEDRIKWYDAEYWMQQAIARERSHSVYRTTYADLLWLLDDLDRANIQAKRALAADPENVQALYVAGRYAVWGMRRNLNTVSVAYSSDIILYQIAQFRGEDEKARVEVYYALPEEYVAHQPHSPGAETVDVRQGIFVFNTVWDTVYQSVVKVNLMPVVAYLATRERYLFATERMALLPGTYYMVAEAEDRESQAVGSFRDSVEIRKFGRDSLEVGSLLLARRIQERDEGPLDRERFIAF